MDLLSARSCGRSPTVLIFALNDKQQQHEEEESFCVACVSPGRDGKQMVDKCEFDVWGFLRCHIFNPNDFGSNIFWTPNHIVSHHTQYECCWRGPQWTFRSTGSA